MRISTGVLLAVAALSTPFLGVAQTVDRPGMVQAVVDDFQSRFRFDVRTEAGERRNVEIWVDTLRICGNAGPSCVSHTQHIEIANLFAQQLSAKRVGLHQSATAEELRLLVGFTVVSASNSEATVSVHMLRRARRNESSVSEYKLVRKENLWTVASYRSIAGS